MVETDCFPGDRMDYSSVPSFDLYWVTSSGEMGLCLYSLGSEQRTED